MRDFEDYQTYTRHLCVEHQRLNRLLLEARHRVDAWRAVGDKRTPHEVVLQLREIQRELKHHYAAEEEEGCVEEAICRCPTLTEEGNQLLHQHPVLLQKLAELLVVAESGEERGLDPEVFLPQFEQLYDELHAHEATESRLVQRAFSVSLDIENGNAVR